ncbi:hypothetical protein FQZ97_1216660 [compost metagenome]
MPASYAFGCHDTCAALQPVPFAMRPFLCGSRVLGRSCPCVQPVSFQVDQVEKKCEVHRLGFSRNPLLVIDVLINQRQVIAAVRQFEVDQGTVGDQP